MEGITGNFYSYGGVCVLTDSFFVWKRVNFQFRNISNTFALQMKLARCACVSKIMLFRLSFISIVFCLFLEFSFVFHFHFKSVSFDLVHFVNMSFAHWHFGLLLILPFVMKSIKS